MINWKLILLLALPGLLMSFLTLFVPSVKVDLLLWMVVFIVSGVLLGRYSERKYFVHGLLTGCLNALCVACVHVFFYAVYARYHKDVIVFTEHDPATLNPHAALFIIELIKGLFSALMAGAFAAVIGNGIASGRGKI